MVALGSVRLKSGDGLAAFKQCFAHGLAKALAARGLSQQKKAAKALGVSEPTLSSWLNAESTPRDDESWERIKQVTGWGYWEILMDPDSDVDPYIQFLKREAEARGLQVIKAPKKRPN